MAGKRARGRPIARLHDGGRFDRSRCDDTVNRLIEDAREADNKAIQGLREKFPNHRLGRGPYLDITDSPDFNATFREYVGEFFIDLNIGALQRVYGTFLGLMSHPHILPHIGDVKRARALYLLDYDRHADRGGIEPV